MRILACSNSCPRWDDDRLLPRSPGGLVPMLIDVLARHGGHWIFTAPPDTDAAPTGLRGDIWLHPVELDESLRRRHYDHISIGLFLRLLHYMVDTSQEPVFDGAMAESWAGYEEVNTIYAKQLGALHENSDEELVLINDPHLMLVPGLLAEQTGTRRSRLAYFLGTPWCEPDYFSILPDRIRTSILQSLLRCDVVGFHANRWVDAFQACCERFLPGVHAVGRSLHHPGGVTRTVAAPFPLDVDVLDAMVDEPATARWTARLRAMADGRRVMVRADRLDLWKNVPRGFAAYEAMLDRRPDLADDCLFVAISSVPSRAGERHRTYRAAAEEAVERINTRFGRPGRDAVSLIYPGLDGDSRHCVVAALRLAQAALVNSTYDGLNVFAKEAAFLMGDPATLLLSVNTGVHEQLGAHATPVNPFDVDETGRLMERALAADPTGGSDATVRRQLLRGDTVPTWLAQVFGP